nr:hypothetical protein [Tanacetum cinerariifolium]
MRLPTTSKLSAGDSSFESSDGSSRKRCRPPAATVTSSIHALVPSCVDLLPPCKRFRDSILLEDSVEEDIDTDVLEDIEVDAMAVEVAVDMDVEAGVDTSIGIEIDVGVDVEDEVDSSDRGTMEVGVDVVTRVDIPDDMLMPNAVEHLKPCRALITRKSVRPFPSYSLALRYISHHLDHFTSESSPSHSSSYHSSSGHSIMGHSLSRHTPLDTTEADSSTPLIFVDASLARTP